MRKVVRAGRVLTDGFIPTWNTALSAAIDAIKTEPAATRILQRKSQS